VSEPTAALASLRRRLRQLTATAAVDEALALCRSEPRLFAAGLPASLVFAFVFGAAAALHRGPWAGSSYDDLLVRSLPLAGLLALAWAGRGLSHALVARRLATALGHGVGDWRPVTLLLAQALGSMGTLVAAVPLLAPGLLVAGRFSVLPGLVGVEGRSLADGVRNSFRTPRPAAWRAGAAGMLVWFLWLVVAVNLVLGAVGLVGLLRLMTGLDTTGLGQILDPTDLQFLLAVGLAAFVLVDPVWAVVRSLLFLERSEGPSGAGLERRWQSMLADGTGAPALALVLGLGAAMLVAVPIAAEAGEPVELGDWIDDAQDGARQLHGIVDDWDGAETVLVGPLGTVLREQLGGPVRLPGGAVLPVDAAVLLAPLPEAARDADELARVRDVARGLEAAAAEARALLRSEDAVWDPGVLLAQELAEAQYVIDEDLALPGLEEPGGLRERVRRWWAALWTIEEAPPEPQAVSKPPTPAGRVVVGAVAVLAVLLVLAVLVLGARALTSLDPAQVLLGDPPEARSPLPDPRSRPADNWAAEAEALATEGRYGLAIRTLYLAVLSQLDANGAIEARPGRTNGELLRGFRGPGAWLEFFAQATLGFERVHYGGQVADASDWRAMRRDSTPLLPGGRFEDSQ
jgi:hypothetical protein